MLKNYDTLNKQQLKNIDDSDISIEIRNQRVIQMNQLLENHCKKYNMNFCNIFDYITKNSLLDDIFYLKHNPSNIHQKYEYLLIVFLNTCLKFLKQYYDYDTLLNEIEIKFNKYYWMACQKQKYTDSQLTEVYEKGKFDKNEIIDYVSKL